MALLFGGGDTCKQQSAYVACLGHALGAFPRPERQQLLFEVMIKFSNQKVVIVYSTAGVDCMLKMIQVSNVILSLFYHRGSFKSKRKIS